MGAQFLKTVRPDHKQLGLRSIFLLSWSLCPAVSLTVSPQHLKGTQTLPVGGHTCGPQDTPRP